MLKWSRNLEKSEGKSIKSDYYVVFINPNIHRKGWNTLRLILEIAQAQYLVFYDYDIEIIELHPVEKNEFKSVQYNPN